MQSTDRFVQLLTSFRFSSNQEGRCMSRYAWLVCQETKEMLWLGKIVIDEETGVEFFQIGTENIPRNSENQLLQKSILKFLSHHISKEIRVVPEEDMDEFTDESFTEIGDDAALDILMSEYVKGFKG